MGFQVGDHVHLRDLGTGIVREVRNRGRFLVEIKGRSLLVAERQLSPADDRARRAIRRATEPQADLPSRAHAAGSIDLHGMTTEEAVSALDGFVSEAILAGLAQIRVIHGRSGGRLKAAVHARLRGMPPVRAFRLDPANPGVTIVEL